MSEGAENPSSSSSFVDLHIHGAFGIDVLTASPADLDRLAAGLLARGVSGLLSSLSVDGASENYDAKSGDSDGEEERALAALAPFTLRVI